MGIDPGYHRCGYGVLEGPPGGGQLLGSGVIVTPAKTPLCERLNLLAQELDEQLLNWRPEGVAVEEIFFTKNVKTAIGVAQARGVVLQRCAAAALPVYEYAPTMVKSQLTGSGRADKKQVEFMVRKFVNLDSQKRLDDELDAIAVALCHSQRSSVPEVLR
jgi:crossover junction endodeoxyribonuclease RuvC